MNKPPTSLPLTVEGEAADKPLPLHLVPKSKSSKYRTREILTRNGDITVITDLLFVLVAF